jgi:hypothetical protein
MKVEGISLDIISKVTGLSAEDLEGIFSQK